uniref:Uncharacterized protein n=1 Tax=Arundo donax TaxID=35708 RepID=A0A0A8XNQ0_ARUDO
MQRRDICESCFPKNQSPVMSSKNSAMKQG